MTTPFPGGDAGACGASPGSGTPAPARAPRDVTPPPADAAARVFAALPGVWDIDRHIPGLGDFRGSASFTPLGPRHLRYRERGELRRRDGARFAAHREFEYLLGSGRIDILFGEARRAGRRYVSLSFRDAAAGGLAAEDRHPCGEDLYHHHFRWHDAGRFETRVHVIGPRTQSWIESRYTRRRSRG